jgi:methionine-gamma-lyase
MHTDNVDVNELRGLTLAIDRSVSFTHVPGDDRQRYARCSHPTALALERDIAALEFAEACRVTSSGMAAISAVLMAVSRPGTRIVTHTSAYSGTLKLISRLAEQWGVIHQPIDLTSTKPLHQEITHPGDVLWLESPANPTMDILPLQSLAAAAKDLGIVTIADNTLCTPIGCNPLKVGVDIVVHSATKYMGGHGDVLAGAICTSDAWMERIEPWRILLGGTLSADAAWLVHRGLSTLEMRFTRHCENARVVAAFLRSHPSVTTLNFPSDPGSDFNLLATSEHPGGIGGLLSFHYAGCVDTMLSRLKHCSIALSLGEPMTLVAHPASMLRCDGGHSALGELCPNLIRVAVGLEDPCLVINDLKQAMLA